MKSITESFKNTRTIEDLVNENAETEQIDEGLKEVWAKVKGVFDKVFKYFKGIVVKAGNYFLQLDEQGEIIPAINAMTAAEAYKTGATRTDNMFVALGQESKKVQGLRTNFTDAAKSLYPKYEGNSLKYFKDFGPNMAVESVNRDEANVNEVRLETADPEAKYGKVTDDVDLRNEILRHIKNPRLHTMLIWGAPGIGKTAILNAVVEELQKMPGNQDYSLICKALATETPDNFFLPKYIVVGANKKGEGGQDKATDVPKAWLPVYKPTGDPIEDKQRDDACGKGLLFIDELSRASQQVQNVLLPLINERKLDDYKLGSGWSIVCASNRMEDEESGQTTLGAAAANRFDQYWYEPTVHTWEKWAKDQGFISPLLLDWLNMPESENLGGGKYFYWDPNEENELDNPSTLRCTPRSWAGAMENLAGYSHTGDLEGFTIFDIPNNVIGRALNTEIPATAIDAFLAFLDVVRQIGDFDKAVYEVWKNEGKGLKIPASTMVKIALPLSQLIITAHANELPTQQEFESMAKYIAGTNSDALASYVLDIFKHVFFGQIADEKYMGLGYVLHHRIAASKKNGLMNEVKAFEAMFKPVAAKYGYKIEDFPDYYYGLKIISAKFQSIFKSTKIEGVEALG